MQWVVVPQWVRAKSSSPPGSKPRQQVRRDIPVHPQPWAYGAGGHEEAGRVIESRNAYRRGREDLPQGSNEGHADGCQWPAGSRPAGVRASRQGTTGVAERGMHAQGALGNGGEPRVALAHARRGGPGHPRPWRDLGASTRACARQGQPERPEAGTGSGSEHPAKRPEMGRVAV
jgi:hypothetical protein